MGIQRSVLSNSANIGDHVLRLTEARFPRGTHFPNASTDHAKLSTEVNQVNSASMRYRELTAPQARDAFVAALAFLSVCGLLIAQVFGLSESSASDKTTCIVMAFTLPITFGAPMWLLLRYFRKHNIESGFLPLSNKAGHLFWQIPLVSIGAATAAICSNNLLDSIFSEQCPAAEESSSISVHLSVIFAFIAYLLVGPFLEELVFRRILMGYFDTIMPVALSIGLSSLLFGLVHISPPIIIYATLLGLGSALFTRWQGTL